jgi:hypothetical protein
VLSSASLPGSILHGVAFSVACPEMPQHECHSVAFLAHALDAVPGAEFIILSLPPAAPELPLLQVCVHTPGPGGLASADGRSICWGLVPGVDVLAVFHPCGCAGRGVPAPGALHLP